MQEKIELKLIEIGDKEVFESFFRKYPSPKSPFHFVNLFVWGSQLNAAWAIYKERLIIYNEKWNCILMPVGKKMTAEELTELSDMFCRAGKCGTVSFVGAEFVENNRDKLEKFEIIQDRNNADYIYLSEKLSRLSGKKLQKKKNLISQFKRIYGDYQALSLTYEDGKECLELVNLWLTNKEDDHIGHAYEKKAFELAFAYFQTLELQGVKIVWEGKIIAFSIYAEQKEDMAVIFFEKFDADIKGAAQLINRETANILSEKYEYINREEDMGIDGLRKAKKSYQPYEILDIYQLKREK